MTFDRMIDVEFSTRVKEEFLIEEHPQTGRPFTEYEKPPLGGRVAQYEEIYFPGPTPGLCW